LREFTEAVAAVGKLQALHRGEKRLGFHLDSLRKQLPSTRSQNIRQWIVDLIGLTQWENVAMLVHGVSLSLRGSGRLDTRLDTPPISFRHHPVSRIAHSTMTPALKIEVDMFSGRPNPELELRGYQARRLQLLEQRRQHTEILPSGGKRRPCRDDGDGKFDRFFASVRKADRDCNIEPPASPYAIMRRAYTNPQID